MSMTIASRINAPAKRRAPGPRGSLVMGNLADYKSDPITMLLRLRENHGDVARNRLGPFLTHALAHPEHVQYVLQDNHRNYVRGRFYDNFKLFFGDGLLTTDGEFWRRHRRAVQPMFHKKHINDSAVSIGASSLGIVEDWQRLTPGQSIDIVPEMMRLSLAILGQMIFNTDISKHAEKVGPLVRFGLEAMMPQGDLNDFIPRWAPTPFNLRVKKARQGIDQIIAQVIEDHKSNRCEASDIISLLLAARHPDTGAPMTQTEVHDEVMTVFLAGHETTGSGLAWALYALAQHPSILRHLREELDAKLGGRAPSLEDLEALPYLDQVVNEALRVYPPIWAFTRDLDQDDEIGGYHIPAGSSIFISPYVTHRHPEFWDNPEAFDPENFASSARGRHKFAYLPFGGGMRKCIGYQMALLITRVLVASVAQHLDLALVPGHPIVRGALISLRPLQGIKLMITPRRRPAPPRVDEPIALDAAPVEKEGAGHSACPFDAAGEGASGKGLEPPAGVSVREQMTETSRVVARETAKEHAHREDFAAVGTIPTGTEGEPETLRFTWFPIEVEPVPPWPSPDLAGKRIAIVNGEQSSADHVAFALRRARALPFIFAPQPTEHIGEAARRMAETAGRLDGIIDLGLESPFDLDAADAWEPAMRRTLALLQACYADWLGEQNPTRLFYLAATRMDGRMGYGDQQAGAGLKAQDYEQPLGGIWAGLAKTLPQELPNCNIRVLDLTPDECDTLADRIIGELYRWGLFEIGYRGGRRYTLQAMRADLSATQDPRLGPGDVVLFSGGARGIGLVCARAIAERTGASVIVTGRELPATGEEPWAKLDAEAFKTYAKSRLAEAGPGRRLTEIRAETARLKRRRALRAGLDELAALGLPVHYRICDVTDAASVASLCAEFGGSLRMIIHNAGIDHPIRLAQKNTEDFLDVVRTKVMGFAHLCAAARQAPDLVQFCNVGSLTGRFGGMTGETDYAAANEALARLGLWASRHALNCTVKTLAWPTWDSVGMISNFEVTKRYVSPMPIDVGVRHWLAELADIRSGEVMFMGAAGAAVTPIQIKGFAPIGGLTNFDELATRYHHVGAPQCFEPFRRFVTRYGIDRDSAHFLDAFWFKGSPALPAALLIEHACGVAGWIIPPRMRPLRLAALTNIRIRLDAAILPVAEDEPIALCSEASGAWRGEDWVVEVRCALASSQREILRLDAVYREAADLLAPLTFEAAQAQAPSPAAYPLVEQDILRWSGHVLRPADWFRLAAGQPGGAFCRARPVLGADLFSLPHPPRLRLPVNHFENALRAAAAESARPTPGMSWAIETLRLGTVPAEDAEWVIKRGTGQFTIIDRSGGVLLDLTNIGPRAHTVEDARATDDGRGPTSAIGDSHVLS
jgi:cytochrome P450/NAD(P)-dependent dehydrogenase (short-subunit alcohol dehydrogenase family)